MLSFPQAALTLSKQKETEVVEPPSITLAVVETPLASPTPEPTPSPTALATAAPKKATPKPVPVSTPVATSDHADLMVAAGIAESDYGYVEYIINHEGSWVPCKTNGGAVDCDYYFTNEKGAWSAKNGRNKSYGICQALPGYKMASAGSDWQTSALTQLRWCNGYAIGSYGSWKKAYEAWLTKHWW